MKTWWANVLAVVVVGSSSIVAPTPSAAQTPSAAPTQAADLTVAVTYTAKAPVNDKNQLWVFLFNTPKVDQASVPLDARALNKNGGTVTFTSVPAGPIYVLTLYDQVGGYDGRSGPPPAGTPIGMYSTDGKTPSPVKLPMKTPIKISFSDAVKFMQ